MDTMIEKFYVVYDADGGSTDCVIGLFDNIDALERGIDTWVENELELCFAEDPKESGLDRETDEKWLREQIRESLGVKEFMGCNCIEIN